MNPDQRWQPSLDQLMGRDPSMIDFVSLAKPLHCSVVTAFRALREDARVAGFELQMASGFRDFRRQLGIWNSKAGGDRPLLDADGRPIETPPEDDWQRALMILRWSALPGASRHHWGTDVDVYDAAAVETDYAPQLTPSEVADDGPFGPLHQWLDECIAGGRSHGFFRPYCEDSGGIAPERWHLSYAPLAFICQQALDRVSLFQALQQSAELALWPSVADHWGEVYERFVAVPWQRYPRQWVGAE